MAREESLVKRTAVSPPVDHLEKQLVLPYLCLFLPPLSFPIPPPSLSPSPAQITQHLH